MAEKAHPAWLRILEVILGIIALILAVYLIFNPHVAIGLLRTLLAIALIVLGVAAIVRGAVAKSASAWGRVLSIILGIIVFVLGVASIYSSVIGDTILVTIFALGLLLTAIGRIEFAGYAVGAGAPQLRGASFALGIIALILAILVIAIPQLGATLLVILAALTLLLLGIALVVSGAGS